MTCKEVKTRKYQTRKGPPYHANECKGLIKKGNDKKTYVSSPDKRGVFKWVLKSGHSGNKTLKKKSGKTYKILDNGGYPFIVEVAPSSVTIFRQNYTDDEKYVIDKTVGTFPYKNIFIGDNHLKDKSSVPKGQYPGNSILLQVGDGKYIYIGSEIYSFETLGKEPIKAYFSAVGNSAVPYPYAVGETNTYFMLDKEAVPNALLNLKEDAYGQFYGHTVKDEALKKQIESSKKKFKSKQIHKRVF